MPDPIENLRLLKAAAKAKADELHLDLVRFAYVPGDPDHVEVSLRLRPESVMTPAERESHEFTKQMEATMLLDVAEPDTTPEVEEAADELQRLKDKTKGWMGL